MAWTHSLCLYVLGNPDVLTVDGSAPPIPQLGLFSAIVTAFLVDSLGNLKQDQTQRTNELLVNLTDIILELNRSPGKDPDFSFPLVFEPSASDIRTNSFYSLSLIFSVRGGYTVGRLSYVYLSSQLRRLLSLGGDL